MSKLTFRKGSWIVFVIAFFAWFASPSTSVKAESYEVNEAKDFFFYWTEAVQLEFRTYAQEYGIDSMLWLFNEQTGDLVAVNDDYFGLNSYITYLIQPNTIYRLRAGVCCGDPNRWYGTSYTLEVSNYIYNPTTTIEETTTSIEETTTTTELITTTTELITTTTEESTTTTQPTTTEPVVVEETTTTEVSTTIPVETTIVEITTTTESTTTSTVVPSTILTTTTVIESTTSTISIDTSVDNKIDNKDVINLLSEDLSKVSSDEIKKIFSSIDVKSLTPEEEQELIKNLNTQNDDVKKIFESEVDVFGNGLDEYVPSGSLVDVGTRRVLIAVTTVASTIGVSASTPSSSKRR